MDRINKNAIESIEVIDKQICPYIEWLDGNSNFITRLLGTCRKEGFYEYFGYHPYSKQDLKDGKYNDIPLIVINYDVYHRPYVKITLCSGQKRFRYFWTYKECCNYAHRFVDENNLDKCMIKY